MLGQVVSVRAMQRTWLLAVPIEAAGGVRQPGVDGAVRAPAVAALPRLQGARGSPEVGQGGAAGPAAAAGVAGGEGAGGPRQSAVAVAVLRDVVLAEADGA